MSKTPAEQSVMVMAMMAAELCTEHVNTPPMNKKRRYEPYPQLLNFPKNSCTATFWSRCMPLAFALSVVSPRSNNARPMMNSPKFLRLLE